MLNKRLTPLGKGRDVRFRYLPTKNGGTAWSTCETNITRVKFRKSPPATGRPGWYVGSGTLGIIITAFATFAFAPLAVPGLILGYGGAGTGTAFAITSSGLSGNLGLAFTGFASALGFASPFVSQAQYANFNKPCTDETQRAF